MVHLDLYGNKLTCFSPCTIHCSKTNHPHNNNRQQQLLSKLEYLDIGYNKLTVLPDKVATLPSLKILKCPNNLIEVIPSSICEMELRVLDVSSNPLVQPPLETCERGLHSMRRYYHCLKLEEMTSVTSIIQGVLEANRELTLQFIFIHTTVVHKKSHVNVSLAKSHQI